MIATNVRHAARSSSFPSKTRRSKFRAEYAEQTRRSVSARAARKMCGYAGAESHSKLTSRRTGVHTAARGVETINSALVAAPLIAQHYQYNDDNDNADDDNDKDSLRLEEPNGNGDKQSRCVACSPGITSSAMLLSVLALVLTLARVFVFVFARSRHAVEIFVLVDCPGGDNYIRRCVPGAIRMEHFSGPHEVCVSACLTRTTCGGHARNRRRQHGGNVMAAPQTQSTCAMYIRIWLN